MSEKAICIIPARIGSKRLLRKNIKEFHGRPLLAWTLIQARNCKYVEDIYVTTDSEEIAAVAREYGAQILMRENYIESLDATSGGVPTVFAVKRLAQLGPVETILSLFDTSPLRRPGDLDRLCARYFELLQEREGDSQGLTVGFAAPRYETFIARRLDNRYFQNTLQDKTFTYMDQCGGSSIAPARGYTNSVINLADDKTWRDPIVFSEDSSPHPYVPVDWWQCFEIDRPEDFDICLYFFGLYLKNQWEEIYDENRRREGSRIPQ